MAAPINNHTMFAGETRTFTVTSRDDATGALIDFTSATIEWIVKDASGASVIDKTVGSGITVTATGVFTISLATAATSSLSGDYAHECVTVLADGTRATLFTGTLHVNPTLVP